MLTTMTTRRAKASPRVACVCLGPWSLTWSKEKMREDRIWRGHSRGGMYSNFPDVWFDNTTPGLNDCSFNSFARPDPINRLGLSPDYLARKLILFVHPGGLSILFFPRCILSFVLGDSTKVAGIFEWLSLNSKSWSYVEQKRRRIAVFLFLLLCPLCKLWIWMRILCIKDTRRVSKRAFLIIQWHDKSQIANMEIEFHETIL